MRTETEIFVATDYRIVYEDDFFLIVDKPAPLPVHKVGRFKEKNLLSLLEKQLGQKLYIVNRLDSETSGLVIATRSGEMAGRLGRLFENRQVEKEYRALVRGVPAPASGVIAIALGTERRHFQHVRVPDPAGESAETFYEVLDHRGPAALLRIVPRTGRTHQIRAHLAFAGHPVIGDKIYIDPAIFERYVREGWQEDMRAVVGAARLQLHAVRLAFTHPVSGRKIEIESEPPFGLS